jgi:FkbM family methyltransferase
VFPNAERVWNIARNDILNSPVGIFQLLNQRRFWDLCYRLEQMTFSVGFIPKLLSWQPDIVWTKELPLSRLLMVIRKLFHLKFKWHFKYGNNISGCPMDPQLIYDVGAHLGEDTDFYLRKGFKVVAIEANPVLALKLKERFRSHVFDGSIVVVSAAIAQNAGEVSFYVNESASVWGTIRSAWAKRNESLGRPSKLIKVEAISFPEVLGKYGVPHYLKIDIEGADVLPLEALIEHPGRPKFISIESEKRSWRGLLYEFEMFKRLGYSRFKIVDQGRIDSQKPPNPPAEGRYVEHRFEPGSSGLFGEELPGKWLTARQAIWRYRFIFLRYRFFGDYGILRILLRYPGFRNLSASWYDTHATI